MIEKEKRVSIESKMNKMVITFFTYVLNITLIILGLILIYLLCGEIYHFVSNILTGEDKVNHYIFLERILLFFLYFEFIAMIVKYFKEDYHFPLRYFIYLGITALTRLIILSHDNPKSTLLFSCSIFLLAISLSILNLVKAKSNTPLK
ncbi:MAG: psiE [Bacillales bacterium]|jgi:protein PsiE|nr:psiE [Bacillales bacterium]